MPDTIISGYHSLLMKRIHTTFIVFICLVLSQAAGSGELSPYTAQPGTASFELPDVKGQPHKLGYYRGQVVLVNFWASWCPPCIQEMPVLERLGRQRTTHQFPARQAGKHSLPGTGRHRMGE